MVYSGPISTCCHECRRRKVKCDGVKPECERCTKRGTRCTGFPEHFKIITSQTRKHQKAGLKAPRDCAINTRNKIHASRREVTPSQHADGPGPLNRASEHRESSTCDQKELSAQQTLHSTESWLHGAENPLISPFDPPESLPNTFASPTSSLSDDQSSSADPYLHRSSPLHRHIDRSISFETPLSLNEHMMSPGVGFPSPAEDTTSCFNDIHGKMDYGTIFESCDSSTSEWSGIGGLPWPHNQQYPLCDSSYTPECASPPTWYEPIGFDPQAVGFEHPLGFQAAQSYPYFTHVSAEELPNVYHGHKISMESHGLLDLYMGSFFV